MSTTPKPYAFILMPFSEEFNDVYDGIKLACQEANVTAQRADEHIHTDDIMQIVYTHIKKADLIIAEMSTKSPNVFYEVGYAHALGKRVILLARESQDIPFDLNHYPHIIYHNQISKSLRPELIRSIRAILAEPQKDFFAIDALVHYYNQGRRIDDGQEVKLNLGGLRGTDKVESLQPYYTFQLDIQNNVSSTAKPIDIRIGLITQDLIKIISEENFRIDVIKLPDERTLHLFDRSFFLNPGTWKSIRLNISGNSVEGLQPIMIRTFSDNDIADLHFFLELEKPMIPMGVFSIHDLHPEIENLNKMILPLGYDLDHFKPFSVDLSEFNSFFVTSPPRGGKSTLLKSFLRAVQWTKIAEKLSFYIVDFRLSLKDIYESHHRRGAIARNDSEVEELVQRLEHQLLTNPAPDQFIILAIDDSHLLSERRIKQLKMVFDNYSRRQSIITLVSSPVRGFAGTNELARLTMERGIAFLLGTDDVYGIGARKSMTEERRLVADYPGIGYFVTPQDLVTIRIATS